MYIFMLEFYWILHIMSVYINIHIYTLYVYIYIYYYTHRYDSTCSETGKYNSNYIIYIYNTTFSQIQVQ